MVLQLLANRKLMSHINADRSEIRGHPDARQHEDLGRVVAARAQQHFAVSAKDFGFALADEFDTRRTASVKDNLRCECSGHDVQIGAIHRGMKVCVCGTESASVPLRNLEKPDTLLHST